jgi:hypothetical protein
VTINHDTVTVDYPIPISLEDGNHLSKKVMYIDKLTPLDLLFPQPRQLREDYDGSLL